ncbi:MAG: C40 family peptidase [Gemmatimonadota bacterium]|nr:C40 family peptidase [Gemmatimonadota bacterium]
MRQRVDIWLRRVKYALSTATIASFFSIAPLAAQRFAAADPGLFEMFAARRESSSSPLFGGIAIGGFNGALGFRVGGSLHFGDVSGVRAADQFGSVYHCGRRLCRNEYQGSSDAFNIGAWTADADVVVEPFRQQPVLKSLFLGFSPYGFAGIGGYGVTANNVAGSNIGTWSYGAGVRHDFFGGVALEAEARARRALRGDSALAPTLRQNVEYRVGLAFHFGGESSNPRRGPDRGVPRRPRTEPCNDESCAPRSDANADEATQRLAARILDAAAGYIDSPYRSGGTSPRGGFDAAGFVQYVFGKEGVRLPSSASEMASVGTSVSIRVGTLRPGDLLFFANDGSNINHVAIYAGRERIVHATASGDGVRYDVLGEGERGRWFADHLVSARRVLDDAARIRSRGDIPPQQDDRDRPDRAPKPNGTSSSPTQD